jgi:pimeloyl-ACP methyl ester carboxylesterase
MPIQKIDNHAINYEIVGDRGPWMTISSGSRNPLGSIRPLAQCLADRGYRVVIHDRRNCGASDVIVEGDRSEYQIWADDLHALMAHLDALPAIFGGSSSGCRLSILSLLSYPDSVRALLLWRVTGGGFAATRLSKRYYSDFIDIARRGGMEAICATGHFAERIRDRPSNRDLLMGLSADQFIRLMDRWRRYFLDGAEHPVIGAPERDLASISVPTCIVPGNDRTHPRAVGREAHRLIPGSELHEPLATDHDLDVAPAEEWSDLDHTLADIFADFLQRRTGHPDG